MRELPRIPEGLLTALRERFPFTPHTPTTSLREADWEGGRQEVIRFLADHETLQKKEK